MGWLWADQTQAEPSSTGQSQPQEQTPAQAQAAASAPAQPSSDVDPEIQKFLALFQTDTGSSRPADPAPPPPKQASPPPASSEPAPKSSWSSWFSRSSSSSSSTTTADPSTPSSSSRTASEPELAQIQPPPASPQSETDRPQTLSPLAESLLPTEMSCQQAFNQAFYCQSVGGQWTSVYRAGSMRSCSDHWDDFWFCMRTKAYAPKMREDAIRAHYRARELDKYHGKPSSEDVWREREEKVPLGTAFAETYERPDASDAEWQKAEMERLRRIREGL
ncbi:hypothetical protein NKR23_g10679 [Pleurostoma richardsiae]|uniref:Early meiotic induction protein 1 n=1 Tax=Pleurostoma richardsiae TaxID=41990 RepID=A0AA38RC69_9PEZI|nr:hypothetical protein NKR23_g10679 [Pleurostoma richardsiae]